MGEEYVSSVAICCLMISTIGVITVCLADIFRDMEELGIVETAKVQEETPATKPALPTTYDELDSDDLYVRWEPRKYFL